MCVAVVGSAIGQNIKGHYVSKTDDSGTVYHTLPCTFFEAPQVGELTFDITYRSNSDGMAVINFTFEMGVMFAIDSVCFTSGRTQMRGAAKKIYISPLKKEWKHRYSFTTEVKSLYSFFDVSATPQVVLYGQGKSCVYKAKPSAWKSAAPVQSKIFEMIRVNEQR